MFGSQLKFAIEAINERFRPLNAGSSRKQSLHKKVSNWTALVMQVVISLACLGLGIWGLVKSGASEDKKMAWGLLGLVAGYWLR